MRDYLEEWLEGELGAVLLRRQSGGTGTVRRSSGQEGEEVVPLAAERDILLEESDLAQQGAAEGLDLLAEAAAAPEEIAWPVSESRERGWPAGETAEQPLPGQGELPQESGAISPQELYAALGQTASVSWLAVEREARHSPTIVTVPIPATEERRDWEDLDRAVQRDARRYDGGFALY